MYIFDINSRSIEITDLEAALKQADYFRNLKHESPGFEKFNQRQTRYWQDIYDKLVQVKGQAEKLPAR